MSQNNNDNNAPDLNTILKTLSAFSNQTNNHPHQPHPQETTTTTTTTATATATTIHDNANDNDNSYEPPDIPQPPLPHPPQTHNLPSYPKAKDLKAKDPSPTITTWPAALKQVMRTVAANEDIQRRIRFLIHRQHDHEKQWWRGREALLQKQRSRKEKKRELDEVLRSVGAPVDEKDVSTAEEDLAEIQNYDAKVYKASKQMADAMLAELRGLNVPFFCVKRDLVTDEADNDIHSSGHGRGTLEKQDRTISIDELSALQHRMLELLQDLCRE